MCTTRSGVSLCRTLVPLLQLLVAVGALFAENIPSDPVENPADFRWYKTQFATGGTGNCGPACAAMVIHWATGDEITVKQIRTEIGEPNGSRATSLAHQKKVIDDHSVNTRYTEIESIQDLKELIDRGSIAILWVYTGTLTKPEGDVTETRIGRYYDDECGHYIVVKGYTDDGLYFICHDPIPGDWLTNETRYPDGSMLGEDRYFAMQEVIVSLMNSRVIEVGKSNTN